MATHVNRKKEPCAADDRFKRHRGLLIIADRAGKLRTIDWTTTGAHAQSARPLLRKGGLNPRAARDPAGYPPWRYFKGRHGVIDKLAGRDPAPRSKERMACLRKSARPPISYAELAQPSEAQRYARGSPTARTISIVVPCHRVIGSNGTLTGYARLRAEVAFLSMKCLEELALIGLADGALSALKRMT